MPPPDEAYVQVRVEAAGLNFRDVLNVFGLYPGDPGPVGGDFAGTVTQLGEGVTGLEVGQRVYGSMQGAFASRFNVPEQFLAPIPDGVSPVDAATIPAAALTVRLSFDWAKLNPGDKVLIHAASGGVGLAAIQMAQQQGAEVYATASTFKRATLRKLGVKYVYDSRTTDFADQILADTDGAGVDVVLNSLTSEGFVEATVRATAKNGRFAEIAKRDIWTPEQMAEARPDIAYEIVALDTVMFTEPERIRTLLTEVSDGLAKGEWTPLPAEIYPLAEARTAFRRMQQARHIGKIVCQMPNPLQPRGDRSYLITGGLGAIGLHTAAYLAQLGAGDIVLTSRRDSRCGCTTADRGHHRALQVPHPHLRRRCRRRVGSREAAGAHPRGVASARGSGASGGCARRRVAVNQQRSGPVPDDVGAQGVRCVLPGPVDEERQARLLHCVLLGVELARFARSGQLLDCQCVARRSGRGSKGARLAGDWCQLRSLGQGRYGLFGGRARQYQCARPYSAGTRRPRSARSLKLSPTELGRQPSSKPTGSVRRRCWAVPVHRFSTSCCRVLSEEVTGDSELLRQLQETPVAQRASFMTEFLQREVQRFLRLAQPPAATSRFLDLGTDSLMAVELRNRLHSQFGGAFTINATAVFDYPTIGGLGEYLAAQLPDVGIGVGCCSVEPKTVGASAETGSKRRGSRMARVGGGAEAESDAAPEPS